MLRSLATQDLDRSGSKVAIRQPSPDGDPLKLGYETETRLCYAPATSNLIISMSHFELAIMTIGIAAAALCAALTPILRPLLVRYALARPNARSSHVVPTPQGAGIAVIGSTLLVAGIAILSVLVAQPVALWTVFGATVGIAAIGAADDLHPISVAPRLAMQAVAVGAVLFAIPADLRIVHDCPIWLERGLLLLAALWFVNLVNFMDGLDWMTVAEVVPITGALVAIGLFGGLPPSATFVAAALGGAMIGFAPFNRPVARVFLGDVGSLPIGLLLGWCFLELAFRQHLAAAILLPLYYLADASFTLLRRLVKREAVWLAHRSHFYQRATDNGFTVLQVVGRVFVLNIGLAILAGLSIYLASTQTDLGLLATGAAAVAVVLRQFSTPQR
jgi:UDP-N-acetylmuramyl pentapeptide phosphotransferase/UDP-N-acetylglucosamine-1-phosphate transferase